MTLGKRILKNTCSSIELKSVLISMPSALPIKAKIFSYVRFTAPVLVDMINVISSMAASTR
jgi:hypothetical protein